MWGNQGWLLSSGTLHDGCCALNGDRVSRRIGGSVAAVNVGAGHAAEGRFSQRNGPTARLALGVRGAT